MTLVTSIVYGMWRYRWLALGAAWIACVVGWLYVYSLPNVFQANTRFFIDAESMIKRVVGDLTLSGDVMTEVNVLTRVLLSQPQLEKTARQAGLDLYVTTPAEREKLIENLRGRIRLSREPGGDNIFSITFQDANRETAETVVRTLLDTFVEDALGGRRTDAGAASDFLEAQIREYELRLDEAETRLSQFKRDNIGLMPGETGDYYTRLQAAMVMVDELRAELLLAEQRRDEYQNQLSGETPVFGLETRPTSAASDPTIARFEADLNELLLKYTDSHPDVVALRETIQRLEAQRDARSSVRLGTPDIDPLDVNPVYQRMRIGLSEAEIEVATLKTKLATAEASLRELRTKVDTIPDIERQLTALNRDYEVTRSQHETLLRRRESLHITGQVELSGDELQFRPIDPPRASLTPVGPNRPMLLAGTTVFALGLGCALAFLLHQLNPVFNDRRQLREVIGLPVLGSVSLALTPQAHAQSRQRRLAFAVASAALPAAFALALLLQEPARQFVGAVLGR